MGAGAPPSADPERAPRARAGAEPEPLRDETDTERLDRNLTELLNELRVALPGVQVLFAFLLGVPFTQRFGHVNGEERAVYLATLVATALATACLIAPVSHHRILFRRRRKPLSYAPLDSCAGHVRRLSLA